MSTTETVILLALAFMLGLDLGDRWARARRVVGDGIKLAQGRLTFDGTDLTPVAFPMPQTVDERVAEWERILHPDRLDEWAWSVIGGVQGRDVEGEL